MPEHSEDPRRFAPAAERNQGPILEVLRRVFPERGKVVELAAGTGQHAAFFSRSLPGLQWQPTDASPHSLESIKAWGEREGGPLWRPPMQLDATADDWGVGEVDAILCINMIHISPWSATEGLFRGAGRHLGPEGVLVTYGPYRVEGTPTAESNERFDQSLQARDPSWGLRWLHDLEALAANHGLGLSETVSMPANNLTLVFERREQA